ncbi:hypothetical protein TCAL_17231 [Tigriopus californicus]|uniref:C2H2-type domain-containing protein n=1 Tax=Tigriopus californicus TaxID=6832 RepID=A0A553N6T6_TIGCA|nr:hypothetical protein TCAL_17231 [Tigriopus californicus]
MGNNFSSAIGTLHLAVLVVEVVVAVAVALVLVVVEVEKKILAFSEAMISKSFDSIGEEAKEEETEPLSMNRTKASQAKNANELVYQMHGEDKHFVCKVCGYNTKKRSHVIRHAIAKHTNIRFRCQFCSKTTGQEDKRVIHYRTAHQLSMSASQIRAMLEEAHLN